MSKYFVMAVLVWVFYWLLRKDRVYFIPLILLIYTNINGLLDWEDFAMKGLIKFPDYGFILTLFIILFQRTTATLNKHDRRADGFLTADSRSLYRIILFFWGYYIFEFFYSIALQGDFEWPVKMGRSFLYGLVIFVIYFRLKDNPVILFKNVIRVLMVSTLIFALIYIAYNLLGIDIYPSGAHEEFAVSGMKNVRRNFSGFPTFTFYFIILFAHRLMTDNKHRAFNFVGMILMASCVFLSLTRGAMMAMFLIVMATVFFRRITFHTLRNIVLFVFSVAIAIPFVLQFMQGYFEVLLQRFGEFSEAGGAAQTENFLVRTTEFYRVLSNVLDFNPLFGFGFTNIAELRMGYSSSLIHGGSADNGVSNLIGVTGFVGLGLFLAMILFWLIVNVKLQRLQKDEFSKVHFIFIIFIIGSMANGAGMTYTENFSLFMVYDLLAYSYLARGSNGVMSALPDYSNQKRFRRMRS